MKAVHNVFGEETKNILTDPLANADDVRDSLHGKIAKFLRGARFHFDEAKAGAASNLYRIFKNHDLGLSRASYAVQSTKMNALFSEMEKDEVKKNIAELGMEDTFKALKKAQDDFENLYSEKVEAEAESKETGPVGELIQPVRQDIFYVLTMLEIMERVKPEDFTDVINKVNELVVEMGGKARARNNRKNEDDEIGQHNE